MTCVLSDKLIIVAFVVVCTVENSVVVEVGLAGSGEHERRLMERLPVEQLDRTPVVAHVPGAEEEEDGAEDCKERRGKQCVLQRFGPRQLVTVEVEVVCELSDKDGAQRITKQVGRQRLDAGGERPLRWLRDIQEHGRYRCPGDADTELSHKDGRPGVHHGERCEKDGQIDERGRHQGANAADDGVRVVRNACVPLREHRAQKGPADARDGPDDAEQVVDLALAASFELGVRAVEPLEEGGAPLCQGSGYERDGGERKGRVREAAYLPDHPQVREEVAKAELVVCDCLLAVFVCVQWRGQHLGRTPRRLLRKEEEDEHEKDGQWRRDSERPPPVEQVRHFTCDEVAERRAEGRRDKVEGEGAGALFHGVEVCDQRWRDCGVAGLPEPDHGAEHEQL
mmetsp:Transcript_8356/g.25111  ORF Transcript_8356/g.25111 Transcript_8356/m.25111 type:complete len:396 (-) Transcript_8356:424-1611(-)